MLVVLVLHSINCGNVGAGHGYDNNQCAEFCITSHHFTVNGHEHMLKFTEAGKPWGCADKVWCMKMTLCLDFMPVWAYTLEVIDVKMVRSELVDDGFVS